jgi:nitroreductase
MDTIKAIHTRRSIRSYHAHAVARALIEDILWDAAQAPAPPASGSVPFFFVVIEGEDRVAECGIRALQYARENRGPGPGFDWVDKPGFSVFFNAPVVIVICGVNDAQMQAVQDCNRAGQNLMLSAHARGLGTCWVGSPLQWLRDPATKKELGIPEDQEAFAAFTLGYAAEELSGSPRGRPRVVWK